MQSDDMLNGDTQIGMEMSLLSIAPSLCGCYSCTNSGSYEAWQQRRGRSVEYMLAVLAKKLRNMSYNERDLVEVLAERLHRRNGYTVWVHKKPSASQHFKNDVKHRLGVLPVLQPEVDIIVRDNKTGKLNAIEVKLFRRKQRAYSKPFYTGIGQALALLNYGFDHAALWYLFFEDDTKLVSKSYGPTAWYLIRHKLQLPLEYSFFEVQTGGSSPTFRVMQRKNEHQGYSLGVNLVSFNFLITWKHPNPLASSQDTNEIRQAVEHYLKSKKPLYG